MPRWINDNGLDAQLDYIASADTIHACSSQPADYSGIAAVELANHSMTTGDGGGDYTIADGGSGRRLTISAQNGVSVDTSGAVNFYALSKSSNELVYVAPADGKVVTAGASMDFGVWYVETQDPTAPA